MKATIWITLFLGWNYKGDPKVRFKLFGSKKEAEALYKKWDNYI